MFMSGMGAFGDDRPRLAPGEHMRGLGDMGRSRSSSARVREAGLQFLERVGRGEPAFTATARAEAGPGAIIIAALPVIGFLGFIYLITRKR